MSRQNWAGWGGYPRWSLGSGNYPDGITNSYNSWIARFIGGTVPSTLHMLTSSPWSQMDQEHILVPPHLTTVPLGFNIPADERG